MFGRTNSLAQTPRGIRRTRLRVAALIAVAAVVAGCGGGDSEPALTIGAGDSEQSQVLAAIYAGALNRTGLRTVVRDALGGRADYLAALDADAVAAVGEVNGDLLTALDSSSAARKPDDVTKALNRALPEGLIVGDPADGTDLRPTVVAAATRTAEFPSTLADLGPRCAELTVGIVTGPSTVPTRAPLDPQRDVIDPLRTTYGCAFANPVTYSSTDDLRKALSEGGIQLGVVPGPLAYLPSGGADLVALADPDFAFRAAMVLPLIRKGELTDQQIRKLNYVAGELGTTELADMIRQVREGQARPGDLARNWLDAHAL